MYIKPGLKLEILTVPKFPTSGLVAQVTKEQQYKSNKSVTNPSSAKQTPKQ